MQYRFLDEVDISKDESSQSYSSKWWFYGTRTELEGWLPSIGDDSDFSFLDSQNPSLGKIWTPANWKIKSVRSTALNRFEYQVTVTAQNPTFYGNFTYPRDKNNLATKTESQVQKGAFTITDDLAGYKWDATVNDFINRVDTQDPPWDPATDCPFTIQPDKSYVNVTIPVAIVKEIVYLSGAPSSHVSDFEAFKGIQTIASKSGRVIESQMEQVNDNSGTVFTQWKKGIMLPPSGFTWNTNWKGIA